MSSAVQLGTEASIKRVLHSAKDIHAACRRLGTQITADYRGKPLVCIAVLRGAFVFFADLLRQIKLPLEVDFIQTSSYDEKCTLNSDGVKLLKDITVDLSGKHVLVVEDIVDTGDTLNWLLAHLRDRSAASISVCCLLNKSANRKNVVTVQYLGFDECPNEWVVGYGFRYKSA